jgi:hypothetical protein
MDVPFLAGRIADDESAFGCPAMQRKPAGTSGPERRAKVLARPYKPGIAREIRPTFRGSERPPWN